MVNFISPIVELAWTVFELLYLTLLAKICVIEGFIFIMIVTNAVISFFLNKKWKNIFKWRR